MPHKDPIERKKWERQYYRRNHAARLAAAAKYVRTHKVEIAARNKAQRVKDKIDAMNHYGGTQCACCGESNIKFLTLDHKKNDAKSYPLAARTNPYAWLRQRGYPDIALRVLCYNCNCGRDKNGGICPHLET
jgi:hypothetical protein